HNSILKFCQNLALRECQSFCLVPSISAPASADCRRGLSWAVRNHPPDSLKGPRARVDWPAQAPLTLAKNYFSRTSSIVSCTSSIVSIVLLPLEGTPSMFQLCFSRWRAPFLVANASFPNSTAGQSRVRAQYARYRNQGRQAKADWPRSLDG